MAHPPPPLKIIPVVCALIERNGLVLLARRPPRHHLALKWEFPGGKVECGEIPGAALIRELHEELGCTAEIVRGLARTRHNYGTGPIEMIPFICRLAADSAEPHPREHTEITWVRPDELAAYDLAAADLPVACAYRASDRNPPG